MLYDVCCVKSNKTVFLHFIYSLHQANNLQSDAGSFKVVSSFYFHSSSFRKIEGNKCVGGTEKDFFPVRTPCPVQGKGCTTCMYGVYNG